MLRASFCHSEISIPAGGMLEHRNSPHPVILSRPKGGEESLSCKIETLRSAQGDMGEFLRSSIPLDGMEFSE